ncbi:glycosyltransferase [Butyricicoccus faecihominis]|nr:glycosyltransferase [Butyricicoccus faecihominis]
MILEEQDETKVYSDGRETERRMLEIAENYPEDLSQTAISECYEYTTNNTFSSVRRNILNWYPFRSGSSVLEIGAGMGSITGLLCDRCATVTAVEMNRERAAVISARYPDRNNLHILVGDVNQLEIAETFDYVVFIGVLEYAALFSENEEPHKEFLQTAKRFLKPEGRLLFAIENQYGLKYWCGAAEDHLQEPFVGIEGFQKPRTARTFSRAALKKLLAEAGLPEQRFYAVLPDYKFPTMLFTDEWKPSGSDLTNIAYTYGKGSLLTADERKLYADIAENDVVSFFANSFFVEASAAPLEEKHPVLITARGECKPEYRVITTINSDGILTKQAAHPLAQKHLQQIDRNESSLANAGLKVLTGSFKDGALSRPLSSLPRADKRFREYIECADLNSAWRMTESLRKALLKSSALSNASENALVKAGIAEPNEKFGPVLQNGYVDMTFYNAFLDGNELVFFDQEWCISDLPLEFILYYAVKSIFAREAPHSAITLPELLKFLGIAEERWTSYDSMESAIWEKVFLRTGDFYGQDGYCTQYHNTPKFKDTLDLIQENNERLTREQERLQGELKRREGHIKLLLQSERDLKADTERQRRVMAEQKLQITELEDDLRNKTGWIEQLILSERQLKQEVLNKEGHIQLLLESDRELNRIKNSRSWRFMGYFWRLRDFLVPQGSRRRLAGKMLVKFVKHPLRFLAKCTPKRIRKFFSTVQREGVDGASRRLNDCFTPASLPETQITLEPVNVQAAKSVKDYERLAVPQWENPTVSIVIPVYNQFDFTYACIKSILANSGEVSYEIIVADDCSTDLTEKIEEIISGLRVIRNQENLRFLLNCNHAAKQARGQYILFLNNDTQVQENWLQPLIDLMESDDTIGLTGSKLVYPDGRLQEAGGILWRDGSAWNYGNRSDPSLPEYNYVKETDYISGASIMIRRVLWEEIGGFDERFAPAYCEDSDLAFEVRRRGYQVLYQPLSVVVHFEGVSNGTDTANGQKAYQVTNQKKFYEKWKDVLKEENFDNGENVFLARDRSRNKKTLLMVDHYVPMYDKDAGSRTIYQYLKLWVEMGFSVKFIGDNFFPHQPYTQELQQMGVEVLYGPYYAKHCKEWLKENGEKFDVVFLNRPYIAEKYIDAVKKYTRAKLVYNVCDLHYLREQREYELSGNPALLKSSQEWKVKEFRLIELTDTVFTLSVDEKKIIDESFKPSKTVICPIFIYDTFYHSLPPRDETKDLLFVGGFNHHPNGDAVMWFCTEVLPKIQEELLDVRFHIVGSNPPEEIRTLESESIILHGYVSDDELERLYAECRVCVIPLRYGAGVKGKTIEAMYHGIPIVTTSTGIEGLPGIDKCILATNSAEAFACKVVKLYRDGAVKESSACYEYVRAHYSRDAAQRFFSKEFDHVEVK